MPGRRPSVRFAYAPTSKLSPSELDDLWRIYSTCFDTERASFDASARAADDVVRFYDRRDGHLCGLALVSAWGMAHEGRRIRVIWTGAACLEPPYRGTNAIQAAGLWRLLRERVRHPTAEIFWFFDTFSIKSYIMLPKNLTTFWPRRDATTPPWEQGVIDALCSARCGEAWEPSRGVIGNQGRRLRPGVADASPDHPSPDVQFFLAKNPRHAEGERLPVLVPLNLQNAASIIATAAKRALR